jgi:hypothetical protein
MIRTDEELIIANETCRVMDEAAGGMPVHP